MQQELPYFIKVARTTLGANGSKFIDYDEFLKIYRYVIYDVHQLIFLKKGQWWLKFQYRGSQRRILWWIWSAEGSRQNFSISWKSSSTSWHWRHQSHYKRNWPIKVIFHTFISENPAFDIVSLFNSISLYYVIF